MRLTQPAGEECSGIDVSHLLVFEGWASHLLFLWSPGLCQLALLKSASSRAISCRRTRLEHFRHFRAQCRHFGPATTSHAKRHHFRRVVGTGTSCADYSAVRRTDTWTRVIVAPVIFGMMPHDMTRGDTAHDLYCINDTCACSQ